MHSWEYLIKSPLHSFILTDDHFEMSYAGVNAQNVVNESIEKRYLSNNFINLVVLTI